MESVNLEVVVQGFLAASLVWYAKSVRDVVTIVKLHEWRIDQIENVIGLRRKTDRKECP